MKTTHEIMELVFDYSDQRRYGRTGDADVKPVMDAIEAVVKDAARYQQIKLRRSDYHGDVYPMMFLPDGDCPVHPDALDYAVDEAMRKKTK